MGKINDVNEGLENRVCEAVRNGNTFEEIAEMINSFYGRDIVE